MPWRSSVVPCLHTAAVLAVTTQVHAGEPVLVATDAAFGSPKVYHIDPATGQVLASASLVGTGSIGPTPLSALAFDAQGRLLGFTPNTDNTTYLVDRHSGQATIIGRLQLSAREGGMATFPDGTIYAASTGTPARLFTINPTTGRASTAAVIDRPNNISGLGARADGQLVALDLRAVEEPPALRVINPTTGQTTLLATLSPRITLAGTGGLEIIERDGVETGYYIVSGDSPSAPAQLWRFDPYTGEQVPVGEVPGVLATTGLAGRPCEPCLVDLDGDCQATVFDFLIYFNWFGAGDVRADLDGDGQLTIFDFLAFQTAFALGCH
ncbi:MAG: hypothetical protein KIT54_00780 [Phycisphaeraceae bacterium]|nr:hypothetical protein [Phycisphaeraceae bacterium]